MEAASYLKLPSPRETHTVIKIRNWEMSRRSSAEARDTAASVHRRICIVMPQFYIQRHETLLKPNIRHKLFHFQPRSLTAETLGINLSLKRTLQKRKQALYSFIHLINRLLAVLTPKHGLGRPVHKSMRRAMLCGHTPARSPLLHVSCPRRISLRLLPRQQDASLILFPLFQMFFFSFSRTQSRAERTQPVAAP